MPKYINNSKYLLSDEKFISEVNHVALSRCNSPNNTTDFNTIYKRTLYGLLVEQTIIDSNPDYKKNTDSLDYDIISSKYKIEVKSSFQLNKWWNIGEKMYNGLKVPTIHHFLTQAQNIDFLYYAVMNKNFDVHLIYIVNAPFFEKYLKRSNFKDEWYFDHYAAYKAGHCKIL